MRRLALLGLVALAACATAPVSPSAQPPTPVPTPSFASAAPAEETEGRFHLAFALPRTTWSTSDAITGTATLSVTDGADAAISASGGGPFVFLYAEVGGTRVVGGGQTADCRAYTVAGDAPLASGLTKSGGWSDDDPNADFYRAFFRGPDVHLPVGTWDVTAMALFAEGGCGGTQHELRGTVRVTIEP